MTTFAEGVATASGYDLPQAIMRELLDDFLLVSDDEIRRAIRTLVEKAHTLAEGAGATALAGAIRYPGKVQGKKVAITVSGANITVDQLRQALDMDQA
jgi:threonine dehydratase